MGSDIIPDKRQMRYSYLDCIEQSIREGDASVSNGSSINWFVGNHQLVFFSYTQRFYFHNQFVTMNKQLVFLVLFIAMASTSQVGLLAALNSIGVTFQPSLAASSAQMIYRYEGNTTVTITTASSSVVGSSFWLAVCPFTIESTADEQVYLMVVENYTDHRGNEELSWNNSELNHQAVFKLTKNMRSGEASKILISNELDTKYLTIAADLLKWAYTPTIDDPNRLLLSRSTFEGEETITAVHSKQTADKISSRHAITLNSVGEPVKSQISFAVQSGGDKTLFTGSISIGDSMPRSRLEASVNLVLKEKVEGNEAYLQLAQRFLRQDQATTTYTKLQFMAMVEKKTGTKLERKQTVQTKQLSSSPKLRSDEPSVEGRGNITTYNAHTKRFPVVESLIFLKVFRVSVDLSISMTVVDGTTDNPFNRFEILSELVVEYDTSITKLTLHKFSDSIASGYSLRNDFDSTISLALPVAYGDNRINFGLAAQLQINIRTLHSMSKIGNQLVFSRTVRVESQCRASQQVEVSGIRGFAEIQGSFANFQANQDTSLLLTAKQIVVRDVSTATVIPYSYRYIQRFQTFNCHKTYMRIKRVIIWCDWVVCHDRDYLISSSVVGKLNTVSVTPIN